MGGNKIASAIDLTDDELVQWQETATADFRELYLKNAGIYSSYVWFF